MKIDLSCPVEAWRVELPRRGAAACNVTLYNLSSQQVSSVQVTLTLQKPDGEAVRTTTRGRSLSGAPGRTFQMSVPVEENAGDQAQEEQYEIVIDKVWFDNGSVWRKEKTPLTEYRPNNLRRSTALSTLRELAGEMASGYPEQQGDLWVCVCGRPNLNTEETCLRCHRKKEEVFAHFSREAVEQKVRERTEELNQKSQAALAASSQMQEEREKQFVTRKKKNRRVVALAAALVVVLGGAYGTYFHLMPYLRYRQAVEAVQVGNFAEAETMLEAMPDYAQAQHYLALCRADRAWGLVAEDSASAEQVVEARALAEKLTGEGAEKILRRCDWLDAIRLTNEGQFDQARAMLARLPESEETKAQALRIDYSAAKALLEAGEYEQARAAFTALGDYEDSAEMVKETWYQPGLALLRDGKADEALELFANVPDYGDVADLTRQAYYLIGTEKRLAGEIEEAANAFEKAGNYLDARDQANECFYGPAEEAYQAGRYEQAAALYARIPDYLDAKEKWRSAILSDAKGAVHDLEYQRALRLLSQLPEDDAEAAALRQECVYLPAVSDYEKGNYAEAIEGFLKIPDYLDSAEMVLKCRYTLAEQLRDQKDYDGAAEQYTLLGDYSDAQKLLQATRFEQATALLSAGTKAELERSMALYEELGDYKTSKTQLKKAQYAYADLLLEEGEYAAARERFVALGSYSKSADKVKECDYRQAGMLADAGKTDEAIALYLALGDYEESPAKLQALYYGQAEAIAAVDALQAAALYEQAGNYEDAAQKAEACYDAFYQPLQRDAETAFNQGRYADCVSVLSAVTWDQLPEKYAALTQTYQEACYLEANRLYEAKQPYAALTYYQQIPNYKRTEEKLQNACYLILGTWEDLNGGVYEFRADGTCTLNGETLYFLVEGTVVRTGTTEGELTETHRLTGVNLQHAWLYDQRGDTEVPTYLTKK